MAAKDNLLKSPVGDIQFLAANTPVPKSKGSEDRVYTIKLALDSKKDAKFLEEISNINDAKVVTAQTYRGKDKKIKELLASGKSLVAANSKFKPAVYDSAGNEMEETPSFFADNTGTAQMIVQPFTSDKGGTINLVAIVIHSIEGNTTSSTGTREEQLARIRAML
jgi:hypothetical protein